MASDSTKSKVAGDAQDDTKTVQDLESLKWIRERRSIREFTGEKIPDEHIEMILEAARHAPSPENMLMIRFVVI
ncbi:MAG: nitroreductase family protein, partial [Candidatus Thorarchaeota archaeon]